MGWDKFCAGLKIYFKKHAWGNTELPDFIGALQQGYNENKTEEEGALDLKEWGRTWL
jgi:aminopeptidase N